MPRENARTPSNPTTFEPNAPSQPAPAGGARSCVAHLVGSATHQMQTPEFLPEDSWPLSRSAVPSDRCGSRKRRGKDPRVETPPSGTGNRAVAMAFDRQDHGVGVGSDFTSSGERARTSRSRRRKAPDAGTTLKA
jgi:hypothetical protein